MGPNLRNVKGQNELLFGQFGLYGWQDIELQQNKFQEVQLFITFTTIQAFSVPVVLELLVHA